MRNDAGQQSLGEEAMKEAWKEHYEVTQIQTLWNAEGMLEEIPVAESSQLISTGIITKTISRMRSNKADISSAIVIQMLFSTCIWETGTVEVFGLICNIISSVSIE